MQDKLTPQERKIMDVVFAGGELTVAEVNDQLNEGASYASTRAALSRLVQKGALRYAREGARYVYRPATDRRSAGRSAVRRVMDTFFGGSPVETIDAVLGFSADRLSAEELDRLQQLVESAQSKAQRRKGRR